jgi:hypothetical protein
MADEHQPLGDAAAALDDHSQRDANLAAARAVAQLVPGGGFVAELLSNIPRRREQKQVAFARRLASEVDALWESLDREYIRSDEFADLVEDIVEMTRSRRQMEKMDYYAAALANAATTKRPPSAERDRMIDALEELRLSHLRLLALVATTTDGLPRAALSGSVEEVIRIQWPDADIEEVKADWADLARLGIFDGLPTGMMTANGARDLTVRLRPFGHRFHDFVMPAGDEHV